MRRGGGSKQAVKGRRAKRSSTPTVTPSITDLQKQVSNLTRELRETREQQTATADVLKVISRSAFDLQTVLQTLVESAARLCEADKAQILRPRDSQRFYAAASHGHTPEYNEYLSTLTFAPGREGVVGRVLLEGEPVQIADVLADPDYRLLETQRLGGFRTHLGVPVLREGNPVGILIVSRVTVRPFDDKQIELLTTFADQAAIAIENARLFSETRDALERQTATAEILRVIASSPSQSQPVFEAIAARSVQLVGGHSAAVSIFVGDRVELGAFTAVSPEADAALTALYPRRLADYPLLDLVRGGAVAQVSDIETESRSSPVAKATARKRGFRSLLHVPMNSEDGPIGVITVTRKEPGTFAAQHIQLLQTFADQAVIAISNVRLFDEVQAKTRDLEESLQRQTATSEVLQIISSSPSDLAPVFEKMLENATRVCGAEFGGMNLVEGDAIRPVALYNAPEAFAAARTNKVFRPHPQGMIITAIRTRQVVHIADMRTTLPYLERSARTVELIELAGARTVAVVPMLRDDEVIGAITIYRQEVRPFGEKQIELLSNFAKQAVIAIENARLLKELRQRTDDLSESLQQQTATSEVLQIISSSPSDLAPVFEKMLENATRVCGAEFGSMNLVEDDSVRQAALYNAPVAFAAVRINKVSRPHPQSTLASAIRTKQVVHLADLRTNPAYLERSRGTTELVELGGARTVAVVPMLRDNEVIGTITIFRQEVRPFAHKQIELVSNFARQAVIAIENARLLKELRQRTDDLSESLQQQTATSDVLKVIASSPTEVGPVLQAIVESACQLCESDDATVALKDGHDLVFKAQHGSIPIVWDRIPINRQMVTGRAVIDGQPVHVRDLYGPEGEGFPDAREFARQTDVRTVLSVPLLREGESIGVITLRRTEVEPFSDKQINLLQTFADQAVIAIGNVRLFDEVQARTRELSQSLDDLRTAQDRLVQTEKLASLGQLTAGIAHEIKNPLNFVNNFAALSVELTDELKGALEPAALDHTIRAEVDEITGLLKDNLGKVVQHGKRADSIVKNMLLHSREGSGERRSADINALVGESLNLAYHGARAEKPGFTITLKHDLDPNAGALDLYPQEITRALLNLISNGFYAAIRRKAEANDDTFEPVLSATTRDLGETVEIRIRDNGTGISPEVRAKMFNPFFTTKPTGEGTGLGLSMTHDIIVKQHGGRIDVDTEPGAFTEFIVTLPRDNGTVASKNPE